MVILLTKDRNIKIGFELFIKADCINCLGDTDSARSNKMTALIKKTRRLK